MSTAFRVQMTGGQQTPPNASTASGLGVVIYDDVAETATYKVTVTGLDFGAILGGPAQTANLNDNVAQLHVHSEVPGQPGPFVLGLIGPAEDTAGVVFSAAINGSGSTAFQGRWEGDDPSSTDISAFSALLAGSNPGDSVDLYFDVHTSGFTDGEIRGQWICIADEDANNVAGTGGNDILPGLGGNDTVNGFGGDDDLTGGDLRDRLTGGNGVDTLEGGAGKDFLRGDAGQDFHRGGGGKDKFAFNAITDSGSGAPDRIFDFNPGAGETIDISAIDANLGAGGDQAFVIVGAFSNTAGEALLVYDAGVNRTSLHLDQNGDSEGDFLLVINGNQTAGTGLVL